MLEAAPPRRKGKSLFGPSEATKDRKKKAQLKKKIKKIDTRINTHNTDNAFLLAQKIEVQKALSSLESSNNILSSSKLNLFTSTQAQNPINNPENK